MMFKQDRSASISLLVRDNRLKWGIPPTSLMFLFEKSRSRYLRESKT